MTGLVTMWESLFGPREIAPSDAARALGAGRRKADHDRRTAMTQRLRAELAVGPVAKWEGWA